MPSLFDDIIAATRPKSLAGDIMSARKPTTQPSLVDDIMNVSEPVTSAQERLRDLLTPSDTVQQTQMGLPERAGKQLLNEMLLSPAESLRPATFVGETVGRMGEVFTDPRFQRISEELNAARERGRWAEAWALLKAFPDAWLGFGDEPEPTPEEAQDLERALKLFPGFPDKGLVPAEPDIVLTREMGRAIGQKARQLGIAGNLLGADPLEFGVPPPTTLAEKGVDVAAGVAGFVAHLALTKKLIGPSFAKANPRLADMLAWEMLNFEGLPGQGAVMSLTLNAIGSLKATSLAGKAGKLGAQSATLAGIAALSGAELEDIVIAAMIPPALRGLRILGQKVRGYVRNARSAAELRAKIPEMRETALQELGLTPGATRAEVRRAFRAKIMQYHPDTGGAEADARATQAVQEAYDFLSGKSPVYPAPGTPPRGPVTPPPPTAAPPATPGTALARRGQPGAPKAPLITPPPTPPSVEPAPAAATPPVSPELRTQEAELLTQAPEVLTQEAPAAPPTTIKEKVAAKAAPKKPSEARRLKEKIRAKEAKGKQPHEMTLEEFEAAGHRPADVTKGQWVDIMRRHRRQLGQPETSGTAAAPYSDYEQYWEQDTAVAPAKPLVQQKREAKAGEKPTIVKRPTSSNDAAMRNANAYALGEQSLKEALAKATTRNPSETARYARDAAAWHRTEEGWEPKMAAQYERLANAVEKQLLAKPKKLAAPPVEAKAEPAEKKLTVQERAAAKAKRKQARTLKAERSAEAKALKARLRAQKKWPQGEPVAETPAQLLRYTLKAMAKAGRQAYRAGQKDLAKTHADLVKQAKSVLNEKLQARIMKVIAKARTPAEIRVVSKSILRLTHLQRHEEAWGDFKKAKKALKKAQLRPEHQKKIDRLMDSFTEKEPSERTLRRLKETIKWAELARDDPIVTLLMEKATKRLERYQQVPLRKLPPESIKAVAAVIREITAQSRIKNTVLLRKAYRDLDKAAQQAADEIGPPEARYSEKLEKPKPGRVKGLVTENDKPDTVAIRLGTTEDNPIYLAQQEIEKAYRGKKLEIMREGEDALQAAIKGGVLDGHPDVLKKWQEELIGIPLPEAYSGGKRLKVLRITRDEQMFLYASLQDPDNRRLIIRGVPITFDRHPGALPVTMTHADIRAFEDTIEADGKAIAMAGFKYINGALRDIHLNPAWLQEHGTEVATRKNYWMRVRNTLYFEKEQPSGIQYVTKMALKDMGIFKDRVGGLQPLLMRGFFDAYYAHVNKVSSYAALSLRIRQMRALLGHPTLSQALVQGKKQTETQYLMTWLDDVEALGRSDVGEYRKIMNWLRRKQYVKNLGLNIKTSFKQVPSFWLAQAEIDVKYLRKGAVGNPWDPEIIREIEWESSWLRMRFRGSRVGLVGPTVDTHSLERFVTGKTSGILEKTMWPLHKGDQAAIVGIWRAVKLEGQDKGLSGQALLDYTRERAEHIISKTQPVWDPVHQSGLARRAHTDWSAALRTLYSSQTNQNWNIVRRANWRFKNGKASKGKVFATWANVIIMNALAMSAINEIFAFIMRGFRLRRKEEDRDLLDYAVEFVGNIARMFYGADLAANTIEVAVDMAKGDQAWEKTDPVEQSYRNLGRFLGKLTLAINQLVNSERYQRDTRLDRKGDLKWKRSLARSAKPARTVAFTVFGIPEFPVRLFEGWYRTATHKPRFKRSKPVRPTRLKPVE